MKNLYSRNVDVTTVDNLISGTLVPCKVLPAKLATGSGIMTRGTLVTTSDGETYAAYSGTGDIHGVLLTDIDIEDEDEVLSVPVAFSGEFNQRKIEEVMEITLTALAVANARARQIYIAPMNPAPEPYTSES